MKKQNQKLSNNFTLLEFTKSNTAKRNNIKNTPSKEVISNLRILVNSVLQPARDYFTGLFGKGGVMIKITSGYRSKELNSKVGGSSTSFHLFGYAADCELWVLDNITNEWFEANQLLFEYIKNNLPFTELVWEFGDEIQPDWVHVAYNKYDHRKMVKFKK